MHTFCTVTMLTKNMLAIVVFSSSLSHQCDQEMLPNRVFFVNLLCRLLLVSLLHKPLPEMLVYKSSEYRYERLS